MAHTYESDVELLIQFAKDQGFDLPDVIDAAKRLEDALLLDLNDYSYPER